MTKTIQKNIKLSLEFDSYINKHPELYDRIPSGSTVVLTVEGDEVFNRYSTKNASHVRGRIIEARKSKGRWTVSKLIST